MERKHRHAYCTGTFDPALDNWTTICVGAQNVVERLRACHPVESETATKDCLSAVAVSLDRADQTVGVMINGDWIILVVAYRGFR